jgi:hypothetical protein
MEGADETIQAVQSLYPVVQHQVEEQIWKRGKELQEQLNWAETSFQDEAIKAVRASTGAQSTHTGPPY